MNNESTQTFDAHRSTDEEKISRRAYEIWQREGQPEGRELEHWFRAEEEIRNEQDGGQLASSPVGSATMAEIDPAGVATGPTEFESDRSPAADARPAGSGRSSSRRGAAGTGAAKASGGLGASRRAKSNPAESEQESTSRPARRRLES